MKKIFLTLTVTLLAILAASDQNMPALLIPTDAQSMSMAASTLALEPSAKLDAEAFWGKWAPSTFDDMMAGLDARIKLGGKFALTLDGTLFRDRPYDVTTAEGKVKGSFTPSEMIIGIGGDFKAAEFLSVELKAKMFSSTLSEDVKSSAFGADLIVRYLGKGFNLAAGVCNIGTSSMPMMAKVGGCYGVAGFTATAEADYLFSGALMAGLGLQYSIKDIVTLRAGYHYGDAEKALPSFVSAGLGVKLSGVKLDFAYVLANSNIAGSLMLGLGYSF